MYTYRLMYLQGDRMTSKQQLELLMNKKNTQEEAFEFFDSLEPVCEADMIGAWSGSELTTGHPMEGLLPLSGWHGKRFESNEHVFPLVMRGSNGVLFNLNPATMNYSIPRSLTPIVMKIFKPLISMDKSAARLRSVEHRGVVTSAMLYDALPIIDIFRKVDDNTLLGVMDFKNEDAAASYFFVLVRE